MLRRPRRSHGRREQHGRVRDQAAAQQLAAHAQVTSIAHRRLGQRDQPFGLRAVAEVVERDRPARQAQHVEVPVEFAAAGQRDARDAHPRGKQQRVQAR
jgi:hypothetical protein